MTKSQNDARTYYMNTNDSCPTIAKYGRNLNLLYLDGRIDRCYHRDDTITQIQKILLRKNKANIMLTGSAGCGKTAIVEGLAAVITERRITFSDTYAKLKRKHSAAVKKWKKENADKAISENSVQCPIFDDPPKPLLCDCVIYDVSLTALVGGTKYRGEFEERIQRMIDECRANPEVILFFDEMHHLCRIGASEGCESAAQMLKPALARKDIRVIGATTTEEKAYVAKDKALARRFSEIEVQSLFGDVAAETAKHILKDYCQFHNVHTDASADAILAQVQRLLPHTVFPDNFINVVDETLAGAVFEGRESINITHFYAVLQQKSGMSNHMEDEK